VSRKLPVKTVRLSFRATNYYSRQHYLFCESAESSAFLQPKLSCLSAPPSRGRIRRGELLSSSPTDKVAVATDLLFLTSLAAGLSRRSPAKMEAFAKAAVFCSSYLLRSIRSYSSCGRIVSQ
jgi:hypothetical protein